MNKFQTAIYSNLPTIKQTEKALGTGGIVAILTKQILDISSLVNVGKTLTEQQAIFAAQMIVERFNDLRPDDVSLFSKKFVCGDYGTFYDKLDVQTILEAMGKYDIERHNAIIEANVQQNEAHKLENKPMIIPPDKAEQLKELIAEIGKPKAKHPDFGNRPVVPPPTK